MYVVEKKQKQNSGKNNKFKKKEVYSEIAKIKLKLINCNKQQ